MKNATLPSQDKVAAAWQAFSQAEQLTEHQIEQFKIYLQELERWNATTNITTIASEHNILAYHFQDSLALDKFVTFSGTEVVCDVGSGGGFPGIPLKIKYPSMKVILLEVNNKKVEFLKHIIATLGLQDIDVCDYDWRTFLRKAPYPRIDFFVARASLKPELLIKLFQPGYAYCKATLVYWASKEWEQEAPETPFIFKDELYKVGQKSRRLIFMKK